MSEAEMPADGQALIDTHTHLHLDQFDEDRDAVIERALAAGVTAMIVPATNPEEFAAVLELASRHPSVHAAIGVHPHHAAEIDDAALARVEELVAEGTAIAVGEAGLDYYYDFAPRDRQREVFREQLAIARRTDRPIVIHNRDSDDDVLGELEAAQDGALRFQLHCFSSSVEVLHRALDLGGMISFTGNVTFVKSQLDRVVREVPDDRLMIETDAPYLAPVPFRGRRNEPAHVELVARRLAELRGQTVELIRQMTTDNARRFFRLAVLLIVLLSLAGIEAVAQTGTTRRRPDTTDTELRRPAPARAVDTTVRGYSKLFGIGPLLSSSTYISGSTTKATGLGFGVWATSAPLQPLGIHWFNLDVIYTGVSVPGAVDSAFDYWRKRKNDSDLVPEPNTHNTLDIAVRLVANPSAVVNFFATFGVTSFHNEYGVDRYIYEEGPDTTLGGYSEDLWGINGGIGVSFNIRLPYMTLVPTGELRVQRASGDRPLKRRSDEFFVSQVRAALIIYPDFTAIFR